MHIIRVEIPDADFALFHHPAIDLQTAQIIELDNEHPRQLDLFAPLPSGDRLPLADCLRALGDRCAAAYRRSGDAEDLERALALHKLADGVEL